MKKKKAFRLILTVLLAVLIQLSVLPIITSADAPDVSFTVDGLYSDSGCTTPLPSSGVSRGASVTVKFDFSVSSTATSADSGTSYPFTIPDEIPIVSTMTIPVYDQNDVLVANVVIDPNADGQPAQGTFTLETVEPGTSGYFQFGGKFSLGSDENETPVPIVFTANGNALNTIYVYFAQPAPAMDKSGVFDASASTVDWTIHVNTNDTTVNDGVFSDTLPKGVTYNSSGGTFEVDGTPCTFTADTTSDGIETVTYTFPDTSFSSEKTITFATDVNPSLYNTKITNTAYLSYDGDNGTPVSAASSAVEAAVSYITKSCSYSDGRILENRFQHKQNDAYRSRCDRFTADGTYSRFNFKRQY